MQRNVSRARRIAYGQFAGGVVGIISFVAILNYGKDQHPVLEFIQREQLDSSSLFYTESEEAGAVEFDNQLRQEKQ